MNIDELIKKAIAETLSEQGINTQKSDLQQTEGNVKNDKVLSEAYVAEAGKFNLGTELLSSKTKKAHQELLAGYVKELNDISAKLDGVDKSSANLNNSSFRSLKIDETYNHKGVIYKASNFKHLGMTKNGKVIVYKNKLYHDKTIRTKKPYAERIKTALDNGTAHYRDTLGKHIYMYELRRK